MEEQIKVRDWIVARIVKIEEGVVDSKVGCMIREWACDMVTDSGVTSSVPDRTLTSERHVVAAFKKTQTLNGHALASDADSQKAFASLSSTSSSTLRHHQRVLDVPALATC
jgi:molybdopterin-binding protein